MSLKIRHASSAELDKINQVIESAIMTWDLPDRVKRLSLPSYCYTPYDFEHLEMFVATDEKQNIVGIAALEPADPKDVPGESQALLLHGIYVNPEAHHQGIGTQLFHVAEQAVNDQQYDGLLVKAQSGAEGFFLAMGMERLPAENGKQQYANRFWKQKKAIVKNPV
jgi:predicted N-acetyltransferase YhbS